MPTRISAGVDVSLLFITMICIDCKITYFPYACLVVRKESGNAVPPDNWLLVSQEMPCQTT